MFGSLPTFTLAAGALALQVVFVVAVLLRPRARQPSSMAWILVIVVLPVAGIVLYLIVGEVRTGSRRRRRHRTIQTSIRAALRRAWRDESDAALIPWTTDAVARLARLGSDTQPHTGNRLTLLAGAGDFVKSLTADIDDAQEHVHLLFYIYLDDGAGRAVADALIRAEAGACSAASWSTTLDPARS